MKGGQFEGGPADARSVLENVMKRFYVLLLAVVAFGVVVVVAGRLIGDLVGPKLRELELNSSP